MNSIKNNEIPSASSIVFASASAAYIRPIETEHGVAYGVYGADGNQLATFATRDGAFFAAKQHELEPMLVH